MNIEKTFAVFANRTSEAAGLEALRRGARRRGA